MFHMEDLWRFAQHWRVHKPSCDERPSVDLREIWSDVYLMLIWVFASVKHTCRLTCNTCPMYIVLQEHRIKTITDCEQNYWIKERCSRWTAQPRTGSSSSSLSSPASLLPSSLGFSFSFAGRRWYLSSVDLWHRSSLSPRTTHHRTQALSRLSYI